MIKKVLLQMLLPLSVAVITGGGVALLASKNSNLVNSAYDVWLSQGNQGTQAEFLSWVENTAGKKIVDVVPSEDTNSKVSQQNDDQNQNLAYEVWLDEGNTGTQTTFLNWIRRNSRKKETPTSNPIQVTPTNEPQPQVVQNVVYSSCPKQENKCPDTKAPVSAYDSVKFAALTATYTGAAHTVTVTGVPSGVEINYAQNSVTDIGVHRAFVRLYRADLGEKLLTTTITINKAAVSGVNFANASFSYDGSIKNIKVSGVIPDGVNVSYTMNGKPFMGVKDVGEYDISAILSGNNYQTTTLTARLTINKAEIAGVSFNNQTFVYDETVKNITLTGNLPSGTSVIYTDANGKPFNGATIPGTYIVKATITGGNYQTKVLTATLTIDKINIKGISFIEYSTLYDGSIKDIKVSGTLPKGVSVKYTLDSEGGAEFKGATAVGVYQVVATLTGDYYHKLVLSTKLIIAAGRLKTVTGVKLTEVSSTETFGNTTIMLDWDAVTEADSYDINLFYQDGTLATTTHIDTGVSYNLKRGIWAVLMRNNYNIEIIALPKSSDPNYAPSSPSTPIAYHHLGRLNAPKNVRIENDRLKWDSAPDAQMYEIRAQQFDEKGQVKASCSFNSDSVNNPSESMSDIKSFLKGGSCGMSSGKYRFSVKASTTSNGFWVGTYASDSSSPSAEYEIIF
jgi:hypothetical protein